MTQGWSTNALGDDPPGGLSAVQESLPVHLIATSRTEFKTCSPWPTERSFQKDMKDIQNLRDNLAHANDYAATRDAARSVCECVRNIDGWIRFLAESRSGLTWSAF